MTVRATLTWEAAAGTSTQGMCFSAGLVGTPQRRTLMESPGGMDMLGEGRGFVGGRKIQTEASSSLQLLLRGKGEL